MDIKFVCCFCGEPIENEEELLGVAETSPTTGEFQQQWWAHEQHFVEALHEKVRSARSHFVDETDWEDPA